MKNLAKLNIYSDKYDQQQHVPLTYRHIVYMFISL